MTLSSTHSKRPLSGWNLLLQFNVTRKRDSHILKTDLRSTRSIPTVRPVPISKTFGDQLRSRVFRSAGPPPRRNLAKARSSWIDDSFATRYSYPLRKAVGMCLTAPPGIPLETLLTATGCSQLHQYSRRECVSCVASAGWNEQLPALEDRVLNCLMRSQRLGVDLLRGNREVSVAITRCITWLTTGKSIAQNPSKLLASARNDPDWLLKTHRTRSCRVQ